MTQLFIYPVKSLLPVEVQAAEITSEGLRFDRQYVLIKTPTEESTQAVEHLTIKSLFDLCLFQPAIDRSWSKLTIQHTKASPASSITVPLTPSPLSFLHAKTYQVSISGTTAVGVDMGPGPADFFSRHLARSIRLLFIGGTGRREIPGSAFIPKHLGTLSMVLGEAFQPQRIRFADAAPLLVTSSASEQNARARLPEASRGEDVILRFRPNVHIDVRELLPPYDEDYWKVLSIWPGAVAKEAQKVTVRCIFRTPRCLSLNADLEKGGMVATKRQFYGLLARDRRVNEAFPHKPVFGQYACAGPSGAILKVGDRVEVTERELA